MKTTLATILVVLSLCLSAVAKDKHTRHFDHAGKVVSMDRDLAGNCISTLEIPPDLTLKVAYKSLWTFKQKTCLILGDYRVDITEVNKGRAFVMRDNGIDALIVVGVSVKPTK